MKRGKLYSTGAEVRLLLAYVMRACEWVTVWHSGRSSLMFLSNDCACGLTGVPFTISILQLLGVYFPGLLLSWVTLPSLPQKNFKKRVHAGSGAAGE